MAQAPSQRRQDITQDRSHIDGLLSECIDNQNAMSEWEVEFIDNLIERSEDIHWTPSKVQYEKLLSISEKDYDPIW